MRLRMTHPPRVPLDGGSPASSDESRAGGNFPARPRTEGCRSLTNHDAPSFFSTVPYHPPGGSGGPVRGERMANVLLMPMGSHGDVNPFIPLGQALQARGHAVTLLTSAYFEPLARKARLPFVGIGTVEEFQACLNHPDLWHPRRGFRAVAEWGILPWIRQTYQLVAERHVP